MSENTELERRVKALEDLMQRITQAFYMPPNKSTPQPQAQPTQPTTSKRIIDNVRYAFPEDLETRLNFEEKGDYILLRPKQFLGDEVFAKIASIVRGMGGEYVSAGKDSHFRIPKGKI
jgi:hypothetical protein